MTNRDSHPCITKKIINKLFTEDFIRKVSEQVPKDICNENNKENKLKIAVTTVLMKEISGWIEEKGKLSINTCIATELALPSDIEMCPKWNPPGTYRNQTQTFDWICGRMQSTDIQTRTFSPPTDIVISPTGWLPDPIFGYSLMLGIELKVISKSTVQENINN